LGEEYILSEKTLGGIFTLDDHKKLLDFSHKIIAKPNYNKIFKFFGDRIKVYNKSDNPDDSLPNQIRRFEIESYKKGKSVIILTGAKLRLGVSLPCVDIALNFDTTTTIDINYQTMFRVLTERPNKKYGIYIDLNRERAIKFLYEFNKEYGKGHHKNIQEAELAIQNLLFTFNYNGLNLIKMDTNPELDLYKELITKLELNTDRFDIYFEKKCEEHYTTEIPDWYILEKSTNKIIIGMNQLDLWGGGQQLNRGSKYIENNKHNNENSKLLCVVCNEIQFKSKKNKAYKLFETGFENNTLCYLNNLQNIITSYFN